MTDDAIAVMGSQSNFGVALRALAIATTLVFFATFAFPPASVLGAVKDVTATPTSEEVSLVNSVLDAVLSRAGAVALIMKAVELTTAGTKPQPRKSQADNVDALITTDPLPTGADGGLIVADRSLSDADLQGVVGDAESQWRVVHPDANFDAVSFVISDLPDQQLGFTDANVVTIDPNAAGFGWDVSYTDDAATSPKRMSLGSVVLHELGHYLGEQHAIDGVMSPSLKPGEVRTLNAVTPTSQNGGQVLDASAPPASAPTPLNLQMNAGLPSALDFSAADAVTFGGVTTGLAGISEIVIAGTPGDDSLKIVARSAKLPVPVRFLGGAGSDTLLAPQDWSFDADRSVLGYTDVERLVAGDKKSLAFGLRSVDADTAADIPAVKVEKTHRGGKSVSVVTLFDGTADRNEVQALIVRAGGGTFTLSMQGEKTAAIQAVATDATILQSALSSLASIGAGNVQIDKQADLDADVYTITFLDRLAATDLPTLVADGGSLTGADTQQTLAINGASGGTFTISIPIDLNGDGVIASQEVLTTAPIVFVPDSSGYNAATASALEQAIDAALSGIGGDAMVTTASGGMFIVTFGGSLSGVDVPVMIASAEGLKQPSKIPAHSVSVLVGSPTVAAVGSAPQPGPGSVLTITLSDAPVTPVLPGQPSNPSPPPQRIPVQQLVSALGTGWNLNFARLSNGHVIYGTAPVNSDASFNGLPVIELVDGSVSSRGPPTDGTKFLLFAVPDSFITSLVQPGSSSATTLRLPLDESAVALLTTIGGTQLVRSLSVYPQAPTTSVVSAAGGVARSDDGTARIDFSSGSVHTPTQIGVQRVTALVDGLHAVSNVYRLTAVEAPTLAHVTHFDAPLTLTISYNPSALVPPVIYYLDPLHGPVALATSVNATTHTVSAQLTHFSDYVAADPPLNSTHTPTIATLSYDGTQMILTYNDATTTTVLAAPTDPVTVTLSTGKDRLTIGDISLYLGNLVIDGIGDDDIVIVSRDADLTVSGSTSSATLTGVGGLTIALNNIEQVHLAASGSTGRTLDASGFNGKTRLEGGPGNDTLKGGSSADRYVFSNGWGTDSVVGPGADDTLDLTGITVPLTVSGSSLTDGTNNINQSGGSAGHVDVTFASPATVKSSVNGAFSGISTFIDSASQVIQQLSSTLPLLDRNSAPTLGKLSAIIDALSALKTSAQSSINSILGSSITLGQIVNALKGLTLPTPFNAIDFSNAFSTSWRGAPSGGALEVFVDSTIPTTTITKMIALDLGPQAESLGITLGSTPNFTVNAKFGGTFSLGVNAASPSTAFLKPDATFDAAFDPAATLSVAGVSFNMGLLEATLSGSASIGGGVHLIVRDRNSDGYVQLGDLVPQSVDTSVSPSPTFSASFTAALSPGLQLSGAGSDLASVTIDVTLGGGTIFDSPTVNINVKNGTNPFNNFSNAGAGEIVGMLGQIADFFGSMASQQLLHTAIPFTNVTIGDAIDFAKSFKHQILDPLFKSGDVLKPDSNGDGHIDVKDFNFAGIQSLLNKLTIALGIGTPLKVIYDPATNDLKFNFSFEQRVGIGTPVITLAGAVGHVTTAVNGGATSEIQELVINATSGNFRLAANGHRTNLIAARAPDSTVQTRINSDLGLPGATVTLTDGVYRITFGGTSNVPELQVDASGLVNDGSVQTIIVPATTTTFWLAYPDSGGRLQLTGQLTPVIPATGTGGLRSALAALSGIGGSNISSVTKSQADVTRPATYIVTFTAAFATANPKPVVAAGGFNLNFGASLGDFAGVSTSGTVIPLARLIAGATFGINLGSSDSLDSSPSVFQPGARVDIVDIAEGGKGVSVRTLRAGNTPIGVGEVQAVTVRGASGTFTLFYDSNGNGNADPGETTSAINLGASADTVAGNVKDKLTTDIAALNGNIDSVTKLTRAEGDIYTIFFKSSFGDARQVAGDGSSLVARNERQQVTIVNANGGSLLLSFNGSSGPAITVNGTSEASQADVLAGLGGASVVTVCVPGPVCVPPGTHNSFTVEFTGSAVSGQDVAKIVADPTGLSDALHNGVLDVAGTATFSSSIYNSPAGIVLITKDGVATVTSSTRDEGGLLPAVVNTITGGNGTTNEVQTVTVRAGGGTFRLSFTNGSTAQTADLVYNIPAVLLQSALQGLSTIGANNVTVLAAVTAAGTAYTITFQNALGHMNVAELVSTSSLTARNEVQEVKIDGTSSGNFTVWSDANGNGTQDGGETASIAYDSTAAAFEAAIGSLTGIGVGNVAVMKSVPVWTISFNGGSLAGTNVRPLVISDQSGLQARNETQSVQLLNATGGTFTLSVDKNLNGTIENGETTIAIDYNAPDSGTGSVEDALVALLGAGSIDLVQKIGSGYLIRFGGAGLDHRHVPAMTVGVANLRNTDPLGTLTDVQVSRDLTLTNTTAADLAADMQAAIDTASVNVGLTPGFLTACLTAACTPITSGTTFTAGVVPFGAAYFTPQGDHIHGGMSHVTDNVVSGAIHTVVVDPSDGNNIWVGTVNGGIWKTTNAITGGEPGITWTPLLDLGPDMSIGTLELDPTDPTHTTLVAGIASVSNFYGTSSQLSGIYRTTNAGTDWVHLGTSDLKGLNVRGLAVRGNVIVVAAGGGGGHRGGVYRSIDTGVTFVRLSGDTRLFGLPAGDAFDLATSSSNPNIMFVSIASAGIFRSDDSGATWTSTGGTTLGTGGTVITGPADGVVENTNWVASWTVNIKLSVYDDGTTRAVYAAVENVVVNGTGTVLGSDLSLIYRSIDQGHDAWTIAWVPLAVPGHCDGVAPASSTLQAGPCATAGGTFIGIHPGHQGVPNTAIAADPTDANIVYISGDTQTTFPNNIGSVNFTAQTFRCSTGGAFCTPIVDTAGGNTSTHSDARDFAFDPNNDLIATNDGGIYRRATPKINAAWVSLNGHDATSIQISEHTICTYDHVTQTIICSNQDNGVSAQTAVNGTTWTALRGGDGGFNAVAYPTSGGSVRFLSSQGDSNPAVGIFSTGFQVCNPVCGAIAGLALAFSPGTTNDPSGFPFLPPLAVDAVQPATPGATRFVLGGNTKIYESADEGAHVTQLPSAQGGPVTALAYGGFEGATSRPNILYYADSGPPAGPFPSLWLRPDTSAAFAPGAAITQLLNWPGSNTISAIALDPTNWRIAYVTDGADIYRTTDADANDGAGNSTEHWTNLTGNLALLGVHRIQTVQIIPGSGLLANERA
ncbi:MAG: hypothetical protein ABR507_00180, partial [Actinomycetota bacterium]